jgi:hypothetical protein
MPISLPCETGSFTIDRASPKGAAMFCPSCGLQQPDLHRFCASCGFTLPTHLIHARRPKVTQLFAGVPTHPSDLTDSVLRVSRYADDVIFESAEGSVTIPGRHVRFSMWVTERPECAISLSDDEASRLALFLQTPIEAESAHLAGTPSLD